MIPARENPFAAGRIHGLGYLPQNTTWPELLSRLQELNFTASIVGPCGSGKTTLLDELERRLCDQAAATQKLFLNRDTRLPWPAVIHAVDSLPPGGILLFDGADHLPWHRRLRLKRLAMKKPIGLVITSHHEGILPAWVCCRPQPPLLAELVRRLLGENESLEPSRLEALFEMHNGNLRSCLRRLYDEYAGITPAG